MSVLEKLDNYFMFKSKSEKRLIVLGSILIVWYINFILLQPIAQKKYSVSVTDTNEAKNKVEAYRAYIESTAPIKENHHSHIRLNIERLSEEIEKTKQSKIFLEEKLEMISSMLFSYKQKVNFIDSVIRKAEQSDVELNTITTQKVDTNDTFTEVMRVRLECISTYEAVVRFLHKLENNSFIVEVYKSQIEVVEGIKEVKSKIELKVWGGGT